jgi:4-hydroxybenzoate polyprenyltransferase
MRDFALLARFDRPIGIWLLFWPCVWGVWLAAAAWQLALLAWLLLGSIAMRSAGCVYNDIVDADLDRQVARTASRPLASGRVSPKAAWLWLLALCLVGLVVLVQLRWQAEVVAVASLGLVAAYPFMKRVTWWPQAWLGLVFTWGAPVGWVALRSDRLEVLAALYAGAVFWCIGYDTIYAVQDKEDDALVGVRSSALRLGGNVRAGVIAFYGLALAFWGLAFWLLRADWLALAALLPAAAQLLWQGLTLDPADAAGALARFRSNRFAGALVAAACFVVGNSGLT